MSHNTFGHLFRVTTWGESHGPAIGCVVDGCPPRLTISEAEIQGYLDKRRPGQSRFTTQRREPDTVRILSGVFPDETTGALTTTGTPIAMQIDNVDTRSKDYDAIKTRYRPGHADFTYQAKYGIRDWRGSGRASARETATRVAAGAIARKVVPRMLVRGALVQVGPHVIDRKNWDWDEVDRNPFFSPDAKAAERWADFIDEVRKRGSSTGAIVEVVAEGIDAGLGAPVYGKLDQDIAGAMMSINAVKGVEIGAGFGAASLSGEENGDEMRMGTDGRPVFLSNNAGNLGGISTGQPVVVRFAVKPTSSILTPRRTVDQAGDEVEVSTKGRHDPCVGIRAVPIGEAMLAIVLADHYLRHRGQVGERVRAFMTLGNERMAEAIAAFRRGEIVVVTDDDDRENEGDLILAASAATPEKIAFIIRHTSGIVCAALTREHARRLSLQPMVADNDAPLGTAFTVSVDFRHGLTTGISAEERCNTVRGLANPNAGAADFVRPGHVFPLIAREGGVLMRTGHTEASVDLCKLAGLPPVGVLAELTNDDGTVKHGEEVTRFAETHGLKRVSVADIIAWRQRSEALVQRVDDSKVATRAGAARTVTYATQFDSTHHVALVFGDIGSGEDVLVRLHREAVVEDVFGVKGNVDGMMKRMAAARRGVIVYLREGTVGVAEDASSPRDAVAAAAGTAAHRQEEWREIGLGAQILRDLGVKSIRLIASRERRYVGLDAFGITIEATEPL